MGNRRCGFQPPATQVLLNPDPRCAALRPAPLRASLPVRTLFNRSKHPIFAANALGPGSAPKRRWPRRAPSMSPHATPSFTTRNSLARAARSLFFYSSRANIARRQRSQRSAPPSVSAHASFLPSAPLLPSECAWHRFPSLAHRSRGRLANNPPDRSVRAYGVQRMLVPVTAPRARRPKGARPAAFSKAAHQSLVTDHPYGGLIFAPHESTAAKSSSCGFRRRRPHSIAVVVRLERALRGDAEIGRLLLASAWSA